MAIQKTEIPKAQHDSAWKDALDYYLPQALELCFPELYQLVDWKRGWVNMDKELQGIAKADEIGQRFVDKLISVYLKDGSNPWVLVHLEVEQTPTDEFPERMFIYGIRIFYKYRCPIASCAILTDSNADCRPTFYEIGFGGSRLRQDFLLCKLIDFEKDREKLNVSSNPFATVILFHLDALKAKKQPQEERYQTKFGLFKRLLQKGFREEEIRNLLRFLDFSIALTEPLELQFKNEIHQLEESKHMAYISNIERISMEEGMQKGMQKGIEQERQEVALRLLKAGISVALIAEATELTLERLQELIEQTH